MRVIKAPFRPRGGVHPGYFKNLTADKPARPIPMPPELYVSMAQHLGAPAKPLVKKGDAVLQGQAIGAANGFVSAAVHAPAAGKVKAVEEFPGLSGKPVMTVVIETDPAGGVDQSLPPIPEWRKQEANLLRERIAAAGIVGMGGAGFPTHIKLSPPSGRVIDTLIVNGAECEPYLTADYRLMLEHSDRVWTGAEIIAGILGVKRIAVAIEDNKPAAIRCMEKAMQSAPETAQVVALPTHYPQGAEKQQIYAVTGREVPSGGLPMDVGCLVENAGTCAAICAAVTEGVPLTHRLVTVTGRSVRDPQNVLAPIGTTLAGLTEFCGGLQGAPGKAICGGPMMGVAQATLDAAMTKTTSGLLFLPRSQIVQFKAMPCISCGRCVAACPMGLMPCELSELLETGNYDAAETGNVMDCIECGSCAFECPAHRPLVQYLRLGKTEVASRRRARDAARKDAAKK